MKVDYKYCAVVAAAGDAPVKEHRHAHQLGIWEAKSTEALRARQAWWGLRAEAGRKAIRRIVKALVARASAVPRE